MSGRLANRPGRLRRRSSIRAVGIVSNTEPAADKVATPDGAASVVPATQAAGPAPSATPNPVPRAALLAFARETYGLRRKRSRFLPNDLFGEPTWDILLDLYIATRENRPTPTTSACIGAHVPPTTALRWLRILEARGLVEREDDGRDGRRTFVRLTERGLAAMENWLLAALTGLEQTISAIQRHHGGMGGPMSGAAA